MGSVKETTKILRAYYKGVEDRRTGLPKSPPQKKVLKTAYLNGYYNR